MFIDKKLHLDVFLLIQYMLERHEWVSILVFLLLFLFFCCARGRSHPARLSHRSDVGSGIG
jgi:hypothetical protein